MCTEHYHTLQQVHVQNLQSRMIFLLLQQNIQRLCLMSIFVYYPSKRKYRSCSRDYFLAWPHFLLGYYDIQNYEKCHTVLYSVQCTCVWYRYSPTNNHRREPPTCRKFPQMGETIIVVTKEVPMTMPTSVLERPFSFPTTGRKGATRVKEMELKSRRRQRMAMLRPLRRDSVVRPAHLPLHWPPLIIELGFQ